MARKRTDPIKLQLRLTEVLRRHLERAAERNGRSMNAEIISRLEHSFTAPKLAAEVAFATTKAHLTRDQEVNERLKPLDELRDIRGALDKLREQVSYIDEAIRILPLRILSHLEDDGEKK